MFLHGCASGMENLSDIVPRKSGWLQYAAENDMIVIFPQVKSHYNYNSGGCWNNSYLGRTGQSTKNGIQPKTLIAMVERLVQPQDSQKYDYESPNEAEIIGGIPTFFYNFFRDVWIVVSDSYLLWLWVFKLFSW